jgi:hypothetical protein
MMLSYQELAHLLVLLQPFRAEPITKPTIAYALRIVRESRS